MDELVEPAISGEQLMEVDDIVKMKWPVRRGVGARRPWRVRFLRLLARRQPPAGGWRPQERDLSPEKGSDLHLKGLP